MPSKWVHNTSLAVRSYQGREIGVGEFFQIPSESAAAFAYDAALIADIEDSVVALSWNESDDFSNLTAAVSYLKATERYQSSFAVDKNDDSPQTIDTTSVVLITAERVLWDLQGEYDLASSTFSPALDGVWNLNGTITVSDFVNIARVKVHIYRNGDPWFTVVDASMAGETRRSLTFTCDVDAYASEAHDFDIRLQVEAVVGGDPVSIVISGTDEETAWGMTFLQVLTIDSPT